MKGSTSRRAFVLLCALAVLATACSNSGSGNAKPATPASGAPGTTYTGTNFNTNVPVKAPGVTSTSINVGSLVSITNPVGGNYGLMNDGINAYFDFINSQGGIYGRKLKLTSKRDDQLSNDLNQAKALVTEDNVYAAFVAAQLFTGAPALAKAGIPSFGWNVNPEWAGPSNFFPTRAPYCFQGCTPLLHVLPWAVEQVHAHRVALLGYNIPASADATKANATAINRFGKDIGAQLVYDDTSLQFGQPDYSVEVAKMKAAHVDFVSTTLDANANVAIAKEMKRQGLIGKVTLFYPDLYDPVLIAKNADLFEGAIVDVPVLAPEHTPAPPAVQEYLDYAHAHGLLVTDMTEQGWAAARQLVDALKAAGPNFTWANLIGAWNQQKWYSNGGLVPPTDWTFQHHDPSTSISNRSSFECGNFVRVHNGKYVAIWDDGGAKPWVCFDGHQPDTWQAPVNVSFAGAPFQLSGVKTLP
jgi:ABC-type branched-subunit amino acid transport system substrate-binding protein